MLPPDARAILTDSLRPPPGSVLDHAVATTFTLDLASALAVPLAFTAYQIRENPDPLSVMEAARASVDRVDVFCQAGNISAPAKDSGLLSFLEPMIHPVRAPRPGRLFHPKLWLLRYRDGNGLYPFRLVVLSRNLTADQCWDTCLRLDGVRGTRPHASNRPLADLLKALPGMSVNGLDEFRTSRLNQLAEEIRYVVWELPEDILKLRFHALGIRGAKVPDFTGSRHLIISPFCTETGLGITAPAPTGAVTLVGRQEELDRLPETALQRCGGTLVVNELASVPPDGAEPTQALLSGLHAKVYVVEKGQRARLFVGSANATDAAFSGNVELLVELEGSKWKVGIDSLVGKDAAFRAILEPYNRQAPQEEDSAELALEHLLRDLATVPMAAAVEPDPPSMSLLLTSEDAIDAPANVRITAELLTKPGQARQLVAGEPVRVSYENLAVVDITPFVVLRASAGGKERTTVIRVRLVGDPPGRLDEVLAAQVNTPEKFLQFLSLILGLVDGLSLQPAPTTKGNGAWGSGTGAGVFELLVRSLVDRPAALADLARLVERLRATEQGRGLLPEGFAAIWDAVDEVRMELSS